MQATDDAFERACRALGVDPEEERRRRANAGLGRGAVPHTRDLDRILRLPRRDLERGIGGRHGTAEELRDLLTLVYRRPEAPGDARLFLAQAVALAEIHDFGGLLAPIRVGGGKTLISLLAPVVVGAARPLLLTRASLIEKTVRDWRGVYAPIWRVPRLRVRHRGEVLGEGDGPILTVESYTRVGRRDGDEILDEIDPDVVIADEAHWLANPRAGVTRKVRRRLEARPCRYLDLSGTTLKRSIGDMAHRAGWALGEGSPIPLDRSAVLAWSGYLDERVECRSQPGALVRLCDPGEETDLLRDPLSTIRRAFGRRVAETPGVVVVDGDGPGASLEIRALHVRVERPALAAAVARLREQWETPDGEPVADASARWRHLRELGLGFCYRWTSRPPEDWLRARRAWHSFVRETTRRGDRGLDTELQVARAVSAPAVLARARATLRAEGLDPTDAAAVQARVASAASAAGLDPAVATAGRLDRALTRRLQDPAIDALLDYRSAIGVRPLPDDGQWAAWDAVRRSFTPVTVADWLDDAPIHACARWIRGRAGLVWVEQAAFGERLQAETGIRYYRSGREASSDGLEDDDRPAILSISACSEGLNLQRRSECLVAGPIPTGRVWEQALGRLHRTGQRADEVLCEVLITMPEHVETFHAARADARMIQDTTSTSQKLVYGDVSVEAPEDGGPLW